MDKHIFNMRLSCSYGEENAIADISVELLEEGDWKTLDLSETTPGFLIFVYAIFTCQHMFLRINALERSLLLDSSEGRIEVVADEQWHLEKLDVHFRVKLKSGSPVEDDVDAIVQRMQRCPVSKNLREPPDNNTTVDFLD